MGERRRRVALAVISALTLAACGGSAPGADSSGDGVVEQATSPSAPGPAVPSDSMEAFTGGSVSLTDYAGTPMVVNFWASWCPPCIAEMPDLEAVHQMADGQVDFVGINTQDTPDRAAELAEQTAVTYDLVRDPDGGLFQAFGVFGMPSTFYVDADGLIVGRHTGLLTQQALIDDIREHLDVDLGTAG